MEALASLMEQTQNILRGQQTCFLCQMVIMVVEGRVAVAVVIDMWGLL